MLLRHPSSHWVRRRPRHTRSLLSVVAAPLTSSIQPAAAWLPVSQAILSAPVTTVPSAERKFHATSKRLQTQASSSVSPPGSVYDPIYRRSITDRDGFWLEQADRLRWFHREPNALSKVGPQPWETRWFKGWRISPCENMIDRHVANGLGDRVAIIHDSPVTNSVRKISYQELQDEVSRLAGALRASGVNKGDRVLIYMPMIPETMFAILACTRIGAVHAVAFGGFAAGELAKRIQDAKPKVILSASCGIESPTKIVPYKRNVDEAIRISGADAYLSKSIVFQRPQCPAELKPDGRDVDWNSFVAEVGQPTECVQMDGTDPLYILYTSGTTGAPKGVVRDVASLVPLRMSMDVVYRHKPEQVFWTAADLGWAVGHSYGLYSPLLQGTTTLIYEGKPVGTPDPGAFWRVIADHKVAVLFTAPTALRAIKREDDKGEYLKKYDTSSLHTLFLAGERADPASISWAHSNLRVPVIDHWWQTETGWGIVGNPTGIELLPVKSGSASKPLPGWDVRVLDESGKELPPGEQGNLVIKLPLPPSGLHTLWENHQRFEKSYMTRFPGYYDTADAGIIDKDGYVYIMARSDDVLNVAGHRLSSGQMEEVLQDHPLVAESAVVAMPDSLRGHVPLGIVVLKSTSGNVDISKLESEIVANVRQRVGPLACFKKVVVIKRLPKTRSGKILRNVLRSMVEGQTEIKIPPTIEDATVIDEIKTVLQQQHIATGQSKQH